MPVPNTSPFLSILLAAGLVAGAAPAKDKPKPPVSGTVDCAGGDTIADALAAGVTIITVSGLCVENVVIEIDGVSLIGDPASFGEIEPADPTLPAVAINGADRVTLEDLTIDASLGEFGIDLRNGSAMFTGLDVVTSVSAGLNNVGVAVFEGGSAIISDTTVSGGDATLALNNGGHAIIADSTIQGGSVFGLSVFRNAVAELWEGGGIGVTVQNNAIGAFVADGGTLRTRIDPHKFINNVGDGIAIFRGGSMLMSEAIVTGNGDDGIEAGGGASFRVQGGHIDGNGDNGVELFGASARISETSIDANGGSGIHIASGSSLSLTGGSVSGNGENGAVLRTTSAATLIDTNVSSNADRGVSINGESAGILTGSTVDGNGDRGVVAFDNSTVQFFGGSAVTDNGGHGVRVQAGSSLQIDEDVTFSGNGGNDLSLFNSSYGETFTRDPTKTALIGDVRVTNDSHMFFSSGTFDSVLLQSGSVARFNGFSPGAPVVVNGSVSCSSPAASSAFLSDAIAEAPGGPANALTIGGGTNCPTLIAQGF